MFDTTKESTAGNAKTPKANAKPRSASRTEASAKAPDTSGKPDTTTEQIVKRPFNGLTDEQVEMVLEEIATIAGSILPLAYRTVEASGLSDTADDAYAVQQALQQIGALADFASGEQIVGDFARWMLGPLFREQQQESRHA